VTERLEAVAISIRDLAQRLGISKSQAHRLVKSGEIPGFRVGTTWRVLVREYDAYIERQLAAAQAEYEARRAS
jgi:excisionase family DNA binding protein